MQNGGGLGRREIARLRRKADGDYDDDGGGGDGDENNEWSGEGGRVRRRDGNGR